MVRMNMENEVRCAVVGDLITLTFCCGHGTFQTTVCSGVQNVRCPRCGDTTYVRMDTKEQKLVNIYLNDKCWT